jgi:hypothetical protein
MDAIEYIKGSTFYREAQKSWIHSLVDQVLSDSLVESSIYETVSALLSVSSKEIDDSGISKEHDVSQLEDVSTVRIPNVEKILSIEKLSNIGLLDIKTPIKLNDGLNIFYGKNAGGKSSLYQSICKTFGFEKSVFSDINYEDEVSECIVEIQSEDEFSEIVTWETGRTNSIRNIKVFDSQVSSYLVEVDQKNEFQIARLKSEYFSFLQNLLDKIGRELINKFEKVKFRYDCLKVEIDTAIPDVFKDGKKFSNEDFDELKLDDKEAEKYKKLKRRFSDLSGKTYESKRRNLENTLNKVDQVFKMFGSLQKSKDKDGKDIESWELFYNRKHIDPINERIAAYNEAKRLFNQNKSKINHLIPKDWISSELWDKFIKGSIDFINSLNHDEKTEYLSEKCALCHQPLETTDAKDLINIYREIQKEHNERLEKLEGYFEGISLDIADTISELDSLPKINLDIIEELIANNAEIDVFIDHDELKQLFRRLQIDLDHKRNLSLRGKDFKLLRDCWNLYVKISNNLENKLEDTIDLIDNKKERKAKFEKELSLYDYRIKVTTNRKKFEELYKWETEVKKIEYSQEDISNFKRKLSRLATQFSEHEPLRMFEQYLKEEYHRLNFETPTVWKVKSSTRDGVTKRNYSLGDKRLGEIFSEGERKIHALADFFAESRLNNFTGVFVFDDPVNSLDEERIELVSNRILQLVEAGNQVIVFTHNLIFLNCLTDPTEEPINKLERLANQVVLEPNTRLRDENSRRYKEIINRMKDINAAKEGMIDEFKLRNVYDLISGYLETYVEEKLFKGVISRYRPNIRMHSLSRLKSFDITDIDKILNLYKQTSRKGSRHSQPAGSPSPTLEELNEHFDILKAEFSI